MAEPQPPGGAAPHFPRYALAYAPNPGTLGWLAGSHWLGRCAAQAQPMEQLRIEGIAPEALHMLTAMPRQLGWRAAWVPDFALAPGRDWLDLQHAVHHLAQRLAPRPVPMLQVRVHEGCLALAPGPADAAHAELQAMAATCAQALQGIAADAATATGAVTAPYLFHLPLTGPLHLVPAETQTLVQEVAQDFFADLPPLRIDSLALFSQASPHSDFVLLDHLELRG
ncbi:DUF1045 domain-containing protein [Acidovorax sp. DW039]|uniref:DUF1045 domain-containing protein n=1 Tax=Acidovorax sp. DW039 TaxID=3095606 RepID=UPI00308AE8BD|nr:DUF1045 domain-containing protein [Acidovorax sp. DW039]